MATKKKIKWPCELAIATYAYAGSSYESLKGVLSTALFPTPDEHLMEAYDHYRREAQLSHFDFKLNNEFIESRDIEPLYSYVIDGAWGINRTPAYVDFVHRFMKTLGCTRLRVLVDTMLYYKIPADAAELRLLKCSNLPEYKWNAFEIAFYRKFFWDQENMSPADWERYFSIYQDFSPLYNHIDNLRTVKSQELAFDAAGVFHGFSSQLMHEVTSETCFMQMKKVLSGKEPDRQQVAMGWAKTLSGYLGKKTEEGGQDAELARAIDRVRELEDDPMTQAPTSIGQIEGEVSNFTDMSQLPFVIEAEKTRFEDYQGEK